MISPTLKRATAPLLILMAGLALAGCGERAKPAEAPGHAAAPDYERGPHRGRLLRDGDFALEMTIFEDGVPPEFHVYLYRKDKPLDPRQAQVTVELGRLGGRVDRFAFAPVQDYLRGGGVVNEPHSFDVKVTAVEGGRTHRWSYASYEGRTTFSAQAAQAGGVKTERAGPVTIAELVDLPGRIEIAPEGKAEVRAWYPGRVMSLSGEVGQAVRKGQVLARVESSNSLQTYAIPSPISGVIVEKTANVGGVAGEQPLYVVADPNRLYAGFFVYPRDAERVRVGQAVEVRSLSGDARLTSRVQAVLPTADIASQTLMARVPIQGGEAWRPGLGVEGAFAVNTVRVPLAVRTKGLQRFRDFTVVFAKVGNTYEVRMLEPGRKTAEWTEVLGGLEPGTEYVTDGAFLIRADIDKSGASHDH
ncbi:HlyD family efflux transporter periplasmic adaptor subunit [uncultured Phenylobacterium sp.]|uniref:efflux RND transporter periplasmic adaptor subunit n=1 Tax=uncultured Phenylobacterium sp. TaxID=349273 RepID=UPI0025E1E689|nr:HlyD family efflux transporter periplasmic adaptor subunit [uncultured Phenylobacterium sp.]